MDLATVQENVHGVIGELDKDQFIYQLLLAYGKPKASITRLEKGSLNLSKQQGEVIWKKNLWFRSIEENVQGSPQNSAEAGSVIVNDLHSVADQMRKSEQVSKHSLRFVVVTDFNTLLAVDTKTSETLDIPLIDLARHSHFFLPWAGLEKHTTTNESLADIKAAYRMARLYDQICKDNPELVNSGGHALNVFLSRLLFCFFAEDTEIFPKEGMFTNSISSHTNEDGSDLDKYLGTLFQVMNTEIRKECPAFLEIFPYVNGGLLSEKLLLPKFSRQSRKIILECGDLDWSEINPDIFGSMIQAVVHPKLRSGMGMHYTSVGNIMRVIESLFLNELIQSFEDNFENIKGLEKLRTRLSNIKIFDPACGSGNFLIIAFKELRKLEMDIFKRLRELDPDYQALLTMPKIRLTQFFGIEIDDFAHEIAILSLWLAEHQMNVKYKQNLGIVVPPLPLNPSGHISRGNATDLDWDKVCPKTAESEIYVLGNPPYVGYSLQNYSQKDDMARTFQGIQNYKNLDYISCWFMKGARYIAKTKAQLGFVTTNSICQGEQVSVLWPNIFSLGLQIQFAYRSFKWGNNAKHNAGVTCAIVGLGAVTDGTKRLYKQDTVREVKTINAYLASARNVIVRKFSKPIGDLPIMLRGSSPVDDGNLILSDEEYRRTVSDNPTASKFLKRLKGSTEFINDTIRWCIWVQPDEVAEARSIPVFAERFERVKNFRLASKKSATQEIAKFDYRFGEPRYIKGSSIIVPTHSSERRDYIPIGFLNDDSIITNAAFGIYSPPTWVYALVFSKMHNIWVRAVAGRIREDLRYSVRLCYNTFPLPSLTEKQKEVLTSHAFNVISEQEQHPEKTMAQLYDPELMPAGLCRAHQDLDLAVDNCYRSRQFATDEARLEYLFELYENLSSLNNPVDEDEDDDNAEPV